MSIKAKHELDAGVKTFASRLLPELIAALRPSGMTAIVERVPGCLPGRAFSVLVPRVSEFG